MCRPGREEGPGVLVSLDRGKSWEERGGPRLRQTRATHLIEGSVARVDAEEDSAKANSKDGDETREASSATDEPVEPSADASLATLRVKGVDGQKMYVVKLRGGDTVGKLRGYLERAMVSDGSNASRFEIRNAYPPRTFDDDELTLADAGLTPNATLLLRQMR